jgi:hypothetical protein
MNRRRGLSRGGRVVLALAVGAGVFGIATAVQASIPDANGVVHACYNTNLAHGNPTGALRVIDTAKPDGSCAPWEKPLSWNATGVDRRQGADRRHGADRRRGDDRRARCNRGERHKRGQGCYWRDRAKRSKGADGNNRSEGSERRPRAKWSTGAEGHNRRERSERR